MGDEQPTSPRPEPGVEKPQLVPGGADSVDDPKYGDTPGDPVPRDLHPDENPALDGMAPEGVTEPDDKSQEPDVGTSGVGGVPAEPSA